LVSPGVKGAAVLNSTKRPSGESCTTCEKSVVCSPSRPSFTRIVATAPASSKTPSRSVSRSRMKKSSWPFVSPATRLVAAEWKSTVRPSVLTA
jgi:hypothetical protein